MKKFNSFYNKYSNPSVIGADKLWADNSDVVVGDYHALKEYDGI